MPDSLIKRADQILKVYESKEKKRDVIVQQTLPLDEIKENPIEEAIKKVNPLELTPMEALNFYII